MLVVPEAVGAQNVAGSLEELQRAGELRPGDAVHVTDRNGHRIKGYVVDLSAVRLTVMDGRMVDGWLVGTDSTWHFVEAELVRIERQDALWPSVLMGIGLVIGATVIACHMPIGEGERCAHLVGAYTMPALGIAGIIGGMTDAHMHETLYEAPRRGAGVAVSPWLSTGHLGVRLEVGW